MTDPLFVLTALGMCVALAEWLGQRPFGRSLGGALITIILAALLANLGVIPSASNAPPLYGQLIAVGAPVSIFLMLLDVHLAALRRAGGVMIVAFALGASGTLVGVTAAYWITGAGGWLGESGAPLGGMYVATYVGGSANFNALALHYGVVDQGVIFAGANAVDNVVTTLWLAALLLLPRIVHRLARTRPLPRAEAVSGMEISTDRRALTLSSLATLLALAFASQWFSEAAAAWFAGRGFAVPSVLLLTTVALLLAQLPTVQRLGGANLLGTYGAYLFLAVIGAYCDIGSLIGLGHLGAMLLLFVALAVLIHGIVVFGGGTLLRLQPEVLAVASSANIGGAATAMPIARSLGRMDLLLPGILVGSLGSAVGTYLGFVAVWLLRE